MKRSIIQAFEEMESKLSGHVAVATYNYMTLCVKAEEMALLTLSFNIEGEEKYLEEVAKVAKPDDYTLIVIPNYDEDLQILKDGIHRQYPAFKQDIGQKTVEVSNGQDKEPKKVTVNYLKLTMPPVDESRKQRLTEAIKKIHEECQKQMGNTLATSQAKLKQLCESEEQSIQDEVRRSIAAAKKKWEDHCNKIYNEKIEDVNAGHDKYQYDKKSEK